MTDTNVRTDRWTPGPWQATRNGDAWLVLRGAWDVAGIDGTGEIAHSRYSAMTYEENAANARLIALAPELVEALRGLVTLADSDYRGCPECGAAETHEWHRSPRVSAARALLARLDQEANGD